MGAGGIYPQYHKKSVGWAEIKEVSMVSSGGDNDYNVRVRFGGDKNTDWSGAGRLLGRFFKWFFVVVAVAGVLFAVTVAVEYITTPNEIEAITVYLRNEEGDPIRLTFSFGQEYASIYFENTATGEFDDVSRMPDTDERGLYFDKATGHITFFGNEYANRDEVKNAAMRDDSDTQRIEIRMSKGPTRVSDDFTVIELVWLFYHPEDKEYFRFAERTRRE